MEVGDGALALAGRVVAAKPGRVGVAGARRVAGDRDLVVEDAAVAPVLDQQLRRSPPRPVPGRDRDGRDAERGRVDRLADEVAGSRPCRTRSRDRSRDRIARARPDTRPTGCRAASTSSSRRWRTARTSARGRRRRASCLRGTTVKVSSRMLATFWLCAGRPDLIDGAVGHATISRDLAQVEAARPGW